MRAAQQLTTGDGSGANGEDGLVFFNNAKRQPTPSLRSCTTRYTDDSMVWREVQQAVQSEVAKVVGPLQEQLKRETELRKKMEAELGLVRGGQLVA